MDFDTQYLEVEEKRAELVCIFHMCEKKDGSINKDQIPYLVRLNGLRGVCTVPRPVGIIEEDGEYFESQEGKLWLRISQKLSSKFEKHVKKLLEQKDYIDGISKMYEYFGGKNVKEVICIKFKGKDHSKDAFEKSMSVIIGWLWDIAEHQDDIINIHILKQIEECIKEESLVIGSDSDPDKLKNLAKKHI